MADDAPIVEIVDQDPRQLSDVKTPDLTKQWQTFSPPMLGDPRGTQSDPNAKPPDAPPIVNAYTVAPGSLEAAADTILRSADTATDSYNAMRNYLNANKSWIFSVADPSEMQGNAYYGYGDTGSAAVGGDPVTDPHPDWTAQWSAALDQFLLAAADTIQLAGSYLDAINNAGQFYTKGDKSSEMPVLVMRDGSGADQTP